MRARSDYGGDSSADSQIGEEGDDYGMYPEDAEIAYLERKLFSGKKYRGEKGKKKLAKEWVEKDGFDEGFSDFLTGLETRVFASSNEVSGDGGKHYDNNSTPGVPLHPQQSPMRRDQDGNRVKILRPRALSTEVQSESESADSDDSDDITGYF